MVGKNQFNSVFPAALMMKMQDMGIDPAVVVAEHVEPDGKLRFVDTTCPVSRIIGSDTSVTPLFHSFESAHDPFKQYQSDTERLVKTDLVFSDAVKVPGKIHLARGRDLIAAEVKLTVMPDQTTKQRQPSEWGPELVIRPSTTAYVAMSLFDGFDEGARSRIKDVAADLMRIKDWRSEAEVYRHQDIFIKLAHLAVRLAKQSQRPALLQCLWASEIETDYCAEHTFDMLVWTDAALLALYIFEVENGRDDDAGRALRALIRFSRVIMELVSFGKFSYENAFIDICFKNQNDKEISVSGSKLRRYVASPFIDKRRLPWTALHEIVPEEMVGKLSPERRLDQMLYYRMREECRREAAMNAAEHLLAELGINDFDRQRFAVLLRGKEAESLRSPRAGDNAALQA